MLSLISIIHPSNALARCIMQDVTYPSLPGDASKDTYPTQLQQYFAKMHSLVTFGNGIATAALIYQPFSRSYTENGRKRGGPNAIAVNEAEGAKLFAIYQPNANFKIQDSYLKRLNERCPPSLHNTTKATTQAALRRTQTLVSWGA